MGTETAFEVVSAVLSAEPISVDQAIAAVESDTAGAVVSFSGVVRNHDGGKAVNRLSYSAHPTAHQVMADVVARLAAEQTAEAQGAGGAASQPVRIWAAHRGQALAVCSELVDRIKEQVPIWKEQFFADGTVEWVGAGS